MWYERPKFLWEPESSLKRHHTIIEIDTDNPETKKEVFVNRIEVKTDMLKKQKHVCQAGTRSEECLYWFQSLKQKKTRKAFPQRDKTELQKQNGTSEQLICIAEIEAAGKKIIKMAQSRAFAEEISSLGSANNKKVAKIKQNYKLYSLNAFVDEYQVLCVGGMLKNSSLNNSCTHPILLPSYSVTQEWYCY